MQPLESLCKKASPWVWFVLCLNMQCTHLPLFTCQSSLMMKKTSDLGWSNISFTLTALIQILHYVGSEFILCQYHSNVLSVLNDSCPVHFNGQDHRPSIASHQHSIIYRLDIFFMYWPQIFGLSSIMGNDTMWPALLAFTCVPSLLSCVAIPFMPKSPRFLLIDQQNEGEARNGEW